MSAIHTLLSLAIFPLQAAGSLPPTVEKVANSAMFELCAPLIDDASFDETSLLQDWGARRVNSGETDRAKYALETSDAGTMEIIILADRTVCGVEYSGSYAAVAGIAVGLVNFGWEGRAASWGQVWQKGRAFAVTAWAPRDVNGPHTGTASIVRQDSEAAAELAQWFAQ
jgi:hypothetical protein